jgi:hypothetical protein
MKPDKEPKPATCHPERSEGSSGCGLYYTPANWILRFAQNDVQGILLVIREIVVSP